MSQAAESVQAVADSAIPQPTAKRGRRQYSVEAGSSHSETMVLPATGPLPQRDATIERVTDMSTVWNKAKTLAFMEEPVTIVIADSADPNAEKMVFVAVNGEGAGHKKLPWLPRGVPVTIKRKFVERLARAKKVGIRTVDTRDASGYNTTAVQKSSGSLYTFTVLEDRNPEGTSWLRRVLAEA